MLLIKLRRNTKHRRCGSRDGRSRRNTKKLYNTAGMGLGKPKPTLWQFNLMWDVKGDKKGLCKYISSKRKARENMNLFIDGAEALLTKDTEKAEVSMLSSP